MYGSACATYDKQMYGIFSTVARNLCHSTTLCYTNQIGAITHSSDTSLLRATKKTHTHKQFTRHCPLVDFVVVFVLLSLWPH